MAAHNSRQDLASPSPASLRSSCLCVSVMCKAVQFSALMAAYNCCMVVVPAPP
ncbi:hypothetical protein T4D_850 [Trichinella pseudospiralis]|uniref:Uncharacterized protein n=1 Tax=Trichinella pseudospiralis TaxID=6337 RepID=A0A0V1FYR1_TRIPS|nr:hypothetical protein T4D_850 [Trichinella pseudospiralis]